MYEELFKRQYYTLLVSSLFEIAHLNYFLISYHSHSCGVKYLDHQDTIERNMKSLQVSLKEVVNELLCEDFEGYLIIKFIFIGAFKIY